ncbi:hypothetical protein I6946_04415 [Helicobacter pylori]|uniref:hypothetical protein n=1 Tax=Helicobacter pylori TaxID=210 RepID=UPI0013DDBB44|nr:hypothetical protein [Helicobacter pylori]MBH0308084.1 hypothetical protein [Helicobacter pylori]WQY85011.1 hypothetical protein E5L48_04970 [Helicobacter pylori]
MRVFLPNKDLITKDLTTSQAKAWGNSQFLYYNTQSMRLISVFNIDAYKDKR